MDIKSLIDKLYRTGGLSREEFCEVIGKRDRETEQYARDLACRVREKIYGNNIYIRGLIEFTSYCRNDCYYCGIRRSNHAAERYRLTEEDILNCCAQGYDLGFRTFVLQGGEDGFFTPGEDGEDHKIHQKLLSELCADAVCGRKRGGYLPDLPGGRSGPLSSPA